MYMRELVHEGTQPVVQPPSSLRPNIPPAAHSPVQSFLSVPLSTQGIPRTVHTLASGDLPQPVLLLQGLPLVAASAQYLQLCSARV